MGLFNTYGTFNKVIQHPLYTSYIKTNIPLEENSKYGAVFSEYTRIRIKQYSYVGMTLSAAQTCAKDMRDLWTRHIYAWEWDNTSKIWKMTTDWQGGKVLVIPAANVSVNKVGGDMWNVDIAVNEEITIPYRPEIIQSSLWPYPWTEFENNPDMKTNAFKGYNDLQHLDFDYDE